MTDGRDRPPEDFIRFLVDLFDVIAEHDDADYTNLESDRLPSEYPDLAGEFDATSGTMVTMRRMENGLLIAADLPGATEDELSPEIDRKANTFLLSVSGNLVSCIPLDTRMEIDTVSFTNQVLEVRLTHE